MVSRELRERVQWVREEIALAAARAGRSPSDIHIVAASKKKPASLMLEYQNLCHELGMVSIFGENYVQECHQKRAVLPPGTQIHCIGPLQSNKAQEALSLFDLIETAHSDKILYLLNRYATEAKICKDILLEINVSADTAKHGFAPDDLPRVLNEVLPSCPALVLRGLMTITREYDNVADARPDFAKLRETARICNLAKCCRAGRVELSMGMSADFPIAIEEGATMVRIGTAIFGERSG